MSEKNLDLTFESAMNRLEVIVQELEAGNITLEETLSKFEEGVGLLNFCQRKLAKAEERVNVLIEQGPGNVKLEPWSAQGEKG